VEGTTAKAVKMDLAKTYADMIKIMHQKNLVPEKIKAEIMKEARKNVF
jgi:uncharacterized protein YutE (UPF0331/DUF86 family)